MRISFSSTYTKDKLDTDGFTPLKLGQMVNLTTLELDWLKGYKIYGLDYGAPLSLSGLKQSPRAWFEIFSHIVQIFGKKCSGHTSPIKCIYLILHVDDDIHYNE